MCLPIFQTNSLPQYRSVDVAETKVNTYKTPQCRKAYHHNLNFRRFDKPKAHSYLLLFTAGIGYGQMFATLMVLLYFGSVIAISGFYFVHSFAYELPWSTCDHAWIDEDTCFPSERSEGNYRNITNLSSSSELFF